MWCSFRYITEFVRSTQKLGVDLYAVTHHEYPVTAHTTLCCPHANRLVIIVSMISGQSSSPVMHDACEDLGQDYLTADTIQSLVLVLRVCWMYMVDKGKNYHST